MTEQPKVYPTKQEWMGEVLKPALGAEDSFTDEANEALDRLIATLKELREAHTELIDEIRLLKKREHQLNPFNREILPLLEKIVDEEKLIMDATKNQEQQQ